MALPPDMHAIVPQRLKSLHVQKIAVIRRNGLGDLLMTMPLLLWCKRHIPCEISLVVDSRNSECAAWIDRPAWSELLVLSGGNKYLSALEMTRRLRSRKMDLVLSSKPTPMNLMNLLVGLSGARWRRAVVGSSGWSRWIEPLINWPLDRSQLEIYPHQAEQVLHLLSEGSCTIDASLFPRLRPVERSWVDQFEKLCSLAQLRPHPMRPRLYINLTNNRATSRLNPRVTLQALKLLGKPLQIVLGALPSDESTAEFWKQEISRELGWPVAIALGRELPFTLAALQRSDLVLTGDGGLMHLAAACDKPQLALFGQTCISKWHPLTSRSICLHHQESVESLSSELIASNLHTLIRMNWS